MCIFLYIYPILAIFSLDEFLLKWKLYMKYTEGDKEEAIFFIYFPLKYHFNPKRFKFCENKYFIEEISILWQEVSLREILQVSSSSYLNLKVRGAQIKWGNWIWDASKNFQLLEEIDSVRVYFKSILKMTGRE